MADPKGFALAILQFGEATKKLEDDYALQVGKTTLNWNHFHALLQTYFQALMKLDYPISKSLWETGSGDRQQRNMLRSIAPKLSKEKQKTLLWILDRADDLSEFRNTLIHTHMQINYEAMKLDAVEESNKPSHTKRVRMIKDKNMFDDINQDIKDLSFFAFFMLSYLPSRKRLPSLKRPRLRVVQEQTEVKKKQIRFDSEKKRPRPRKSSRRKPKP